MLSVLQIADLHRSPRDPVTNNELIATLLQEHDQAVHAGMKPVRAITVCGDVIQGCRLGAPNYSDDLAEQYEVALNILAQLATHLLDGDRSRLIVVPGNHDICWNTARSSMTEASEAEQQDALNLLQAPGSPFRWDWSSRRLYRISDPTVYGRRLDAYKAFFARLYEGFLPSNVNGGAWLFPVDGVLFVGFDSCWGTDCFNHAASMGSDTIAQVATTLRGQRSRLRVAVWHHNIEGPPASADYLDQSCVRRLIYHGFRLGLHGHQHYAATAPVYIHSGRDQMMAVVSSASLCAGRRELLPGRSRGFNFLEIDEEQRLARVRSLAMDMEARVQPEYGFNGGSAVREVSWTLAPTDSTAESDMRTAVLHAERAKNEGRPGEAKSILSAHFASLGAYGRALLLETLLSEEAFEELVRMFGEGASPEEAPQVIGALLNARRLGEASALLDRYEGILVPDAVKFYRQRLSIEQVGATYGR